MKYLIGIDGGGTNSRLLASGSNGEILGHCVGKSTNVESNSVQCVLANLKEIIDQFLKESGCSLQDCQGVCLGTAGVDTEKSLLEVNEIVKQLHFPCRTLVVNDAEIALAAETKGEPGVLLISGTGSIGYAVNREGQDCRVGGYGYLVGDEGSAYWVSRKAIQNILREFDRTGEKTDMFERICAVLGISEMDQLVDFVYQSNKAEVARLALCVVYAFEEGDHMAEQIMRSAARHLSAMALALGHRLQMDGEAYPLVFSGSMLTRTPWLMEEVTREVNRKFPLWQPAPLSRGAEWGAVYLAAKQNSIRIEGV